MMKKVTSLLLSAVMGLTIVAGNGIPVSAASTTSLWWDGLEVTELKGTRTRLSPTEVNLQLVTDDMNGDGKVDHTLDDTGVVTKYNFDIPANKKETEMEVGDDFWLGLTVNAASITDIYKITGTLNYDQEYFEQLESGDVVVNGDSGVANKMEHDYVTGWYAPTSRFSLEVNTRKSGNADKTVDNDKMLLMFHMTVKKAKDTKTYKADGTVDKEFPHEFSIANMTVVKKAAHANDAPTGEASEIGDAFAEGTTLKLFNSMTEITHDGKVAGNKDGRHVTISTKNVDGAPGKVVAVPVYIDENTGFNGLTIRADWNAGGSTIPPVFFKSVTLSPELRAYADLSVDNAEKIDTNKYVDISIVATKDIMLTDHIKLVNFNFLVPTTANANTIEIQIDVISVDNESMTAMNGVSYKLGVDPYPMTYEGNRLTSTISRLAGYKMGDINRDGHVNLVDAAMLLQYYNGVRTLDVYQIEAGKVRIGDTAVTLVDVLMIMKWYNAGVTTDWRAKPGEDIPKA